MNKQLSPFDSTQSLSSQPQDETFYQLLVNNLSFRDLLPFLGTVGANLTQNCFFLIENSGAACGDSRGSCSTALSIITCSIDIPASGTQNTFQRFWKSLTWAWIARLPGPTATFIRALRDFLQNNKEEKDALIIYMGSDIYKEISNTPLFGISIRLISTYKENLPIFILTEQEQEEVIQNPHFLLYNPKNESLTLPEDKEFINLTSDCSIEDVFKFIFLGLMPWVMFVFQTISMLSKITGTGLGLDILSCILGAFFGHEKYKVNNTLRRKIANDHWEELKTFAFYQNSASYFGSTLFYLANGFFLLFCASKTTGLKYIGASSLRLFGIFIGINIALFYLYVGLLTKAGIQFTIETGMRIFQSFTKDQTVLNGYINSHMYVDIVCAISSLLFNGILTQTRESIKKCDHIAIKFEQWMDGNATDTNRAKKSSIPWWVHLANVIDILVFALSARAAIAGLLQLPVIHHQLPESIHHGFDTLRKNHYPDAAGFAAALSNLIFTYVSAAPDQGEAWRMLRERVTTQDSPRDEESISTYRDSSHSSSAPATPKGEQNQSWYKLYPSATGPYHEPSITSSLLA